MRESKSPMPPDHTLASFSVFVMLDCSSVRFTQPVIHFINCEWASCVPLPSCSFQTDFLSKPRIVFPVVQTPLKWTIYWRVLCLKKHDCANLLTTRISNCSKFALDTHVFTNWSASYGKWNCSLKADVSIVADFDVFCVYGNNDFVISVFVYFCLLSKINTVG